MQLKKKKKKKEDFTSSETRSLIKKQFVREIDYTGQHIDKAFTVSCRYQFAVAAGYEFKLAAKKKRNSRLDKLPQLVS